jgi:hypothetical protein
MLAFVGGNPECPVPVDVEYVAPGVGRVPCFECEGKPEDYAKLFPPEVGVTKCVDCKGAGFVYISI